MGNPNKLSKFFLYLQSLNDSIFFLLEKDLIVRFVKFIFSQGCHGSLKYSKCHMKIWWYSIYCFQSKEDLLRSNRLWTLWSFQILLGFLVVTTVIQFTAIRRCSINSKIVLEISIHLWRVKDFFAVRQFIPSIQYLPDIILRTMCMFREHCLVIWQSIWRWSFGNGFLFVE